MEARSHLQRHNLNSSQELSARVQSRPFSDPQFDQTQPTNHDFSGVDLFAHDPGPRSTPNPIQTKLTIGRHNDPYEQEADRVAEQVMSMSTPETQQPIQKTVVQREGLPEDIDEIQMKPLGSASLIQREGPPEDIDEIQMKPLGSASLIQREGPPEDIDEIQTKPSLQMLSEGGMKADDNLEGQLNNSKGSGSPLPDNVRAFMEPRFGADFSQVRVHTGSTAIQMNQELNAQAFAHQQDIYFGSGKAPANDALTAHELTHIVQQNPSVAKRQPLDNSLQTKQIEQLQRQAPEDDQAKETDLSLEEEQDWLQAKPQIQLQTAGTIQRAWTGRRQLSGMGFLGKPWVVRKSGNVVNMRLFHEHIFFEDGLTPKNYGHMGKQGLGEDKANKLGEYSKVRTNLDDATMRTAVTQAGNPGEYGLLTNNCQDYVQGVLSVYDELTKNPRVP